MLTRTTPPLLGATATRTRTWAQPLLTEQRSRSFVIVVAAADAAVDAADAGADADAAKGAHGQRITSSRCRETHIHVCIYICLAMCVAKVCVPCTHIYAHIEAV